MTNQDPPSTLADGFVRSALDWQATLVHQMMDLQDTQWRSIAAWQRLLCEANQDLWDRWICRFGGGVPLDG
jgi:hypothetical protein